MPLRAYRFLAVLIALVLVLPFPASAQQATGSTIGRVVDQLGNAIADVPASASSALTGFTRSAISDAEGFYRLAGLPVDAYTIVAEAGGFARLERAGIQVDVSRTTDLTLILRVAQVADTVTVTAESPLVSTTSSTLGEVVNLPAFSRCRSTAASSPTWRRWSPAWDSVFTRT